MNNFQFKLDYNFFLKKLAKNNKVIFEKSFLKLFDFREPNIKRKEFNKLRKSLSEKLLSRYGAVCQLGIHKDCNIEAGFDVDHYIPLSTNELNKRIRKIKPIKGKKVPSQSFGSNDISNLRIACKKCNSHKKHRLIFE